MLEDIAYEPCAAFLITVTKPYHDSSLTVVGYGAAGTRDSGR